MALTHVLTNLKGWRRRTTVMAAVAVAFLAVVAWSMRPQPAVADFTPATRGDLVVSVSDEGETRVRDVYVVSAPVAGRVDRIELDVGDPVIAKETVLALFQPQDPALLDVRSLSEAEAGVGLAQADESRARAELDFARQELKRAEQLARDGTISAVARDRTRLQVRTAEAALNQASAATAKRQADLRTARAAMATAGSPADGNVRVTYIPVRAPVDGLVLKRMQESAGLLPAGTPLLEIGDPKNLEIVTDLLSSDAVKVRAGNEVVIEDWGGPNPLAGVVRRVEPFGFTKVSALGVEEQRVNVIIDITSPQAAWSQLGHGYRVITRIVIQRQSDAVKVPIGALFRTGTEWAVFVNEGDTDGGRARLRTVKIGAQNNLEAQVISGLRENELVIVHPSDQIKDGGRVTARREGT